MSERKQPIAVDLFAGVGGLALGFEQAGFAVLAAVELDPIHGAVHQFNFPQTALFCQSVSAVTGAQLRANSRLGHQDIDVVFGGPPCQGFSIIGKRQQHDPRNQLVRQFGRVVGELRPKYFVMENVAGLAFQRSQSLLGQIVADFNAQGYHVVTPYQTLNAADFGVPQHRQRLFLLGYRHDCPPLAYPTPTTRPATRIDGAIALPPGPTVADAIADLPEVNQYEALWEQDAVAADFGSPSPYAAQLRGFTPDPDNYAAPRIYHPHTLTASIRTRHTPTTIARFAATPPGRLDPVSRFLRLHPDGICNTLRAGTPSSRGSFTSPRPIHYRTPRCITVREAARLHSYPDWFRFHVTKWHGFRQIGNSVPPLLARAVAASVRQALGVEGQRPEAIAVSDRCEWLQFKMLQAATYYGVDSHAIAPRWPSSPRKTITPIQPR
ncbi:DNA cytosine methyltransferase [Spirulina major CS-329]|uniref:DNA cytosine methyltransferase n=1 Tax=Spirulina TaxID=1154 RepID=UPI00232B1CA6|nr:MULTISPECIES: DNA cytosine methyltransferase [Spirulina]MDB9494130.1 DNA cytosine methyltransferase [Spirulina subsalsa CS-330]MDB9502198.1 DNA cytosine methyltransferase [Spirulina major CS-329]